MQKKICRYNQFGHCKYGDKCHFKHNTEKCVTKDCNVSDCERRYPKICIYFRKYGRCKFKTYCSFDHEKPKDILENSEKIAELERKVENLQTVTNKTEPKKNAENGKETSEKFTKLGKKSL